MPAWVLLRHELPDGTWHLDWLLEPSPASGAPPRSTSADPEERSLISFRLPATLGAAWRPNVPGLSVFTAELLPPHRRHYLTLQGDIGAQRGRVTRLASDLSGVVGLDLWPDHCDIKLAADRPHARAGDLPENPLSEGGRRGAEWVSKSTPIVPTTWVWWVARPIAEASALWQFVQQPVPPGC